SSISTAAAGKSSPSLIMPRPPPPRSIATEFPTINSILTSTKSLKPTSSDERNQPMRSLLWKEWREQSWKLVFGSLILAAFAFIGLHARIVADELLLQWVCLLAVALLPVLASTGLVPAERDDGTLETLFSLPI